MCYYLRIYLLDQTVLNQKSKLHSESPSVLIRTNYGRIKHENTGNVQKSGKFNDLEILLLLIFKY